MPNINNNQQSGGTQILVGGTQVLGGVHRF